MGFIAGCLLLALIAKVTWDFVAKPQERKNMLRSYMEKPISSTYLVFHVAFFLMFFLGVFVRSFGELEVTESGWQVWQIGILGFFGLWIVTWFVRIEDLD